MIQERLDVILLRVYTLLPCLHIIAPRVVWVYCLCCPVSDCPVSLSCLYIVWCLCCPVSILSGVFVLSVYCLVSVLPCVYTVRCHFALSVPDIARCLCCSVCILPGVCVALSVYCPVSVLLCLCDSVTNYTIQGD